MGLFMLSFNIEDLAKGTVGDNRRRELINHVTLILKNNGINVDNLDQETAESLCFKALSDVEPIIKFNKASDSVMLTSLEYLNKKSTVDEFFKSKTIAGIRFKSEKLYLELMAQHYHEERELFQSNLESLAKESEKNQQEGNLLENQGIIQAQVTQQRINALKADYQKLVNLECEANALRQSIAKHEAMIETARHRSINIVANNLQNVQVEGKYIFAELSAENRNKFSQDFIDIHIEHAKQNVILDRLIEEEEKRLSNEKQPHSSLPQFKLHEKPDSQKLRILQGKKNNLINIRNQHISDLGKKYNVAALGDHGSEDYESALRAIYREPAIGESLSQIDKVIDRHYAARVDDQARLNHIEKEKKEILVALESQVEQVREDVAAIGVNSIDKDLMRDFYKIEKSVQSKTGSLSASFEDDDLDFRRNLGLDDLFVDSNPVKTQISSKSNAGLAAFDEFDADADNSKFNNEELIAGSTSEKPKDDTNPGLAAFAAFDAESDNFDFEGEFDFDCPIDEEEVDALVNNAFEDLAINIDVLQLQDSDRNIFLGNILPDTNSSAKNSMR